MATEHKRGLTKLPASFWGAPGTGAPQNEAGISGAEAPQGWRPVWDKQDANRASDAGQTL